MKRTAGTVILVCTLLLAGIATAGEAGAVRLSLEDALARAMAANPRVRSAETDARARDRAARAEKGRGLGELQLNGGLVRSSDQTLIRPMTPELLASGVPNMPFDDQYTFWSLSYRVPLLGWGTVSGARESARLAARAGSDAARRTALEIRHRVLATYVGLLSLDARIAALEEELTALDSLVGHIELGWKTGQYSRVDVLKARVDYQTTTTRLRELEATRQGHYADLMALLGEDEVAPGRYRLVPIRLADTDTVLPPLADLVRQALHRRSDLQAARSAAAARRAAARIASGSRLPQVSIGGKLTGVYAGTIDYDDTYWSVDAMVSVPLFDMGRRKNLARKADLNARSAELDVKELEGRIRAEVAAALADIERARSAIATQQTALALATEVSRLEQLRYDSNRGDIDNLLRSRAQRRLAEASLIQARHDFVIALDNLQLVIEGDER